MLSIAIIFEYESKGNKDKRLTTRENLNMIRSYLRYNK